ncbi:UNVERIFIED_CONTAM: hypothetical protein GTU68_055706 [Idotea baltica]|nr:hypothetical protein [Idotea baltica]
MSHFFKQNFSQVTNPPVDPLREERVMSLKTRFKNLGNVLETDETQRDVFVLESPVLTTGMYERLKERLGVGTDEIDCTFDEDTAAMDGIALRDAIARIRQEAEDAVRAGREHIILTDEHQSTGKVAIPMILATGAVHSHLVAQGLRSFCSITVRSSECLDTHYFAVLVGVGATCINAYLAQDVIADRHARGLLDGLKLNDAVQNYKKAVEAGLLKIMSKMGISVISSYRGGYNFEALGLSRALVADYFPGMSSRISGLGLAGLEENALARHEAAFDEDVVSLPIGGFYRLRASEEPHALDGNLIHTLQAACDRGDYSIYKKYSDAVNNREPIQLRDLLDFKTAGHPKGLSDVQSINEIRKRFLTPGMSLGALSPEAHGTLNVAMNRIGAKSVSGEGGEVRERYKPLPNGDNMNSAVKQVASGRFGVTAEYLNECRELEIKIAQGAKPGEGGQLPGFKVTEFIAKNRHATPGVTLISPPPHHDIYSIEDLAQLIYDLKQINPDARVCVKLVAQSGVGTVAAGVAKAKADVILIAGGVGGTGASPQTSIKYAGLPWELGLAEAHQILSLNNLRDKVTLRTDGGLRTGRDIVMAAMLMGAEEGEKMQLEYGVQNTMRAIGARSSSSIVRKFGQNELPEGRLHVRLEGSAGQSLGAFSVQGLLLEVIGDANDYVGKGLSGASIVVAPKTSERRHSEGDAIIGNTCLYGATSGKLFAAGTAGVRFAVRNSGAETVVEGCGANGCEYMTGGRAVILGPVGDNFGAGMTGGAAFIWDPDQRFERVANPEAIDWYPLGDMPAEHIGDCKALMEAHAERTGSIRASDLLEEWDKTLSEMVMIVPKETAKHLLGKTKPKARKKAG